MALEGYYAKKTMMGLKEVPTRQEADVFVMEIGDVDIYNGRLKAAQDAKTKAENDAVTRAQDAYKDANKKANDRIAKVEADYRQQIADLKDENEDLHYEIEAKDKQVNELEVMLKNSRHFSENMTRIMHERSNQQRGIKPKKDHDGYIVLDSRQYPERYSTYALNDGVTDSVWLDPKNIRHALKNKYIHKEQAVYMAWKSTIQTPWDASLPLRDIQDKVQERLCSTGKYNLMYELGVHRSAKYFEADAAFFIEYTNSDYHGVMYRLSYRANYKTGLWEVDVYTTSPLEVPAERRPVPVGRKEKSNKRKDRKEK